MADNQSDEDENAELEEELELVYGAQHVIKLFVPVSICMIVVIITIATVNYFTAITGEYLVYTPFHPEQGDTNTQTFVKTILNTLIVLATVVVMTFFLLLLYKLRCYKIMHGWILLSTVMLLFLFVFIYIQELLRNYSVPMDIITTAIFVYNFGVLGVMNVHWKGPLILQQGYLIFSATLMALVFIKYMPEWTLWVVLGVIACWDLVAVLCPGGPLRLLVEEAQARNESLMPALIYSSTVMYPYTVITLTESENQPGEGNNKTHASEASRASGKQPEGSNESLSDKIEKGTTLQENRSSNPRDSSKSSEKMSTGRHGPINLSASNRKVKVTEGGEKLPVRSADSEESQKTIGSNENKAVDADDVDVDDMPGDHRHESLQSARINELRRNIEHEEDKGVKLGLGDFIFYSVLVGKASTQGDNITTIACFIAILMGLFLTLVILVTLKKPLPALPISIFFGLVMYFGTIYALSPFAKDLAAAQIFI